MPEAAVLAHAPDAGGERLGQDQVAEHLVGVGRDLIDRRARVAPVEVAQEVAAIALVEREQRRRLRQQRRDEPHTVVGWEAAARDPRVRRDDVRRDQRVLEVERGDVAVGGEDLPSQARPRGSRPCGRPASCGRGRARRSTAGGSPARSWSQSMTRGSKQNVVAVGRVERCHAREQVVHAVDGLALGVRAVELDVPERALGLLALVLERRRPPRLAAAQRQRVAARPRCGRSTSLARSSWRCTRPRPGKDHSGTTIGWPALS